MFKLEDFWKIMNLLLSGENLEGLDMNIESLARSQQSRSEILFNTTIDQVCHQSQDEQRLRKLLIDWYSTNKTMIDVSKNSKDVFSLSDIYLNELFNSFGYSYNLDYVPSMNKPYFFLDLVNLYKIKGTPLSLYKALTYYGVTDIQICEYWLYRNEKLNKLMFREEESYPPVDPTDIVIPTNDIPFDTLTLPDPHWMLSEREILKKNNLLAINLPSKSPYFSIKIKSLMSKLHIALSILMHKVLDEYNLYKSSGYNRDVLTDNLLIKFPQPTNVSLYELYLACAHTFKKMYGENYGSLIHFIRGRYLCYNGTKTTDAEIEREYYNYILTRSTYNDPLTRAMRQTKLDEFDSIFTRPATDSFIEADPGDLLLQINPTLKLGIDNWLSVSDSDDLVRDVYHTMSDYIKYNINVASPYLLNYIFGDSINKLKSVINFFKPYRARLIKVISDQIIQDCLGDYINCDDDGTYQRVINTEVDYNCADSTACPVDISSRAFYDYAGRFDVGIVDDSLGELEVHHEVIDPLNCNVESAETGIGYGYETDRLLGTMTEHITNGSFSVGGSFDGWVVTVGTGTITKPDDHVIITSGASDDTTLVQDMNVQAGYDYILTLLTSNDGTNKGRISIQSMIDSTATGYLITEQVIDSISESKIAINFRFSTTNQTKVRITIKPPNISTKSLNLYYISLSEFVKRVYDYGGFYDFDSIGHFDCIDGNDVCDIIIQDTAF